MNEATAAECREISLGSFERDGFLAPVPLLTAAQCRLTMSYLRSCQMAKPVTWVKGLGASERFIYDIASSPALLELLRELIGTDVILWGAAFVGRKQNSVHPWHCDIEACAPDGGFVSVWIGIENASADTGLGIVQGSHRFGRTIQEVQAAHGFARGEASDEQVLEWARELDADAVLSRPEISDGQAIVFDGRLWHCGRNTTQAVARTALLLQFAKGDRKVRMPDRIRLEWPIRLIEDERPPVVAVSGAADTAINDVMSVPDPAKSRPALTISSSQFRLPLSRDLETGWKPHFLFNGPTPTLEHMACHISVLEPGCCPHPPHVHIQEEILIVLDGEAEIVLPASPEDEKPALAQLGPGDFVYHPAFQYHTLRNKGVQPVTYLMLKWRAAPLETIAPLGSTVCRIADYPPREDPKPFDARLLFQQESAFLKKLHCHVTDLKPDAGYEPHADDYDVAIVLLEGQIATAGETLSAPAIVYFSRDEVHGMHNPGTVPARYLVFELHGVAADPSKGEPLKLTQSRRKPGIEAVARMFARATGWLRRSS